MSKPPYFYGSEEKGRKGNINNILKIEETLQRQKMTYVCYETNPEKMEFKGLTQI